MSSRDDQVEQHGLLDDGKVVEIEANRPAPERPGRFTVGAWGHHDSARCPQPTGHSA